MKNAPDNKSRSWVLVCFIAYSVLRRDSIPLTSQAIFLLNKICTHLHHMLIHIAKSNKESVWLWATKNNRLLHNHPFPLITAEDFRLGQLPFTLYFCMQLSSLEAWFWNHRCWNKTPFFQALHLTVFWMKQFAPGKLCIYSVTENLVAFTRVLVKDVIQVHLHILHRPCRSCCVHMAFHPALKNKYHAAQTEFLLVSQWLSSVLQNKRAVFWCFVNNDAHTKYLCTPTGTVPNDWFS